jgi:heat-inducible transcriptional repressor
MTALEKRTGRILGAIVAEYIATGEPVGSRTLAKRKEIPLSPASVRNIMSDLTDLGYITQPHVSAGRIPTDRGFRFFVDSLLETEPLAEGQEASIEYSIKAAGLDLRDIFRQSSSVLAGLSRQAGVVAATPAPEQTFKTIEFIKVADDKVLVVLISTSGLIQNKIILDEDNLDQSTLERYARMLNDMLKQLDLEQARERIERELATERARVDLMLSQALKLGRVILSYTANREVFIEGQSNIIEEPEFAQVEKLKAVLFTFEEKSKLLRILDKTMTAHGIHIWIGSEHGLDEIESCTIMAYPVRLEEAVIGSIGVIGPKRMNYQKVVPLVEGTARVLMRILRD